MTLPFRIPVLETERLILRAPCEADLPAATRFWASERSVMMGGPWSAETTATEFADLSDQWARHGFGMFVVTLTGTDAAMGLIGPFYPAGHPEPELVWSLWDATCEDHGYAREAASAARDWFFAATDHCTAVSYTHPDNHRSHRLAEALGASVDAAAPCPYPPPVRVYRHDKGVVA
jgi:RimJ/RimL family protein N-acetyltransferase